MIIAVPICQKWGKPPKRRFQWVNIRLGEDVQVYPLGRGAVLHCFLQHCGSRAVWWKVLEISLGIPGGGLVRCGSCLSHQWGWASYTPSEGMKTLRLMCGFPDTFSNGEGGIFHLRRLCKGGNLHDKKHYPTFTGSASYWPSPLSGSNPACSLQWWVLTLSACGQLIANLVSKEHPLLLQVVSCEWANTNISVCDKGQWKFVRQHLTFSREGRYLEGRLLTLGFFPCVFKSKYISNQQLADHSVLDFVDVCCSPTKDCRGRRRLFHSQNLARSPPNDEEIAGSQELWGKYSSLP